MKTRWVCGCLAGLLVLLGAAMAQGADTVETCDEGAVDFEFFLGGDALNLDEYEKTVYSELVLGYGLLPAFSGYVALGAEADEFLVQGEGGYSFGLIGTPLDTDHVDLDLMLDVSLGGEGFAEPGVAPGLELNIDLLPDQEVWGVYARLIDAVSGRDVSVEDDPTTTTVDESETRYELQHAIDQTYGTYVTIAGRHQILAEYYHTSNTNPADDELSSDSGGFAVGYNIVLVDNLELITHINCHPGHDHQDATWGASLGIVVTIPRAPSAP
jgi:hypothetical protein